MYPEIFDKPEMHLDKQDIIAVFTVRDDIARLPWFIEYYKNMGVKKFFAVDNDSKDGTSEFLQQHEDVVYFHTTNSYVSSKAGRYWTTELCDFYGKDRWCLTLDVDENLVFPGCEQINLLELCEFMDNHNFEGLFTIFLDMYSDCPLSQAEYIPGTPFTDTCRYFDWGEAYKLKAPQYFPPVQIFGGPRQRIFWGKGNKGNGPSMRKIPLVKWKEGFQYYHSTHSTSSIRLADFTGALLHFKFFASFEKLAINEVKRGDRMQMADYQKYSDIVREQDLYFKNKNSIYYQDSLTLVENGVITSTKKLINFVGEKIRQHRGRRKKDAYRELAFTAKKNAEKNASLPLKYLPTVWSIVNHSLTELESFRRRLVPNLESSELGKYLKFGVAGDLLYINEKYICGWAYNPIDLDQKLTVLVFNNQEFICQTVADLLPPSIFTPQSQIGNVYFKIPTPKTLLKAPDNSVQIKIIPGNISLLEQPIEFNGITNIAESNYDGVCEKVYQGVVRGWVWNQNNPQESVDISIYIDEKLISNISASQPRQDLINIGKGTGQYGFYYKLPRELDDGKARTLSIRISNTALHLRKTPLVVSNGNIAQYEIISTSN